MIRLGCGIRVVFAFHLRPQAAWVMLVSVDRVPLQTMSVGRLIQVPMRFVLLTPVLAHIGVLLLVKQFRTMSGAPKGITAILNPNFAPLPVR